MFYLLTGNCNLGSVVYCQNVFFFNPHAFVCFACRERKREGERQTDRQTDRDKETETKRDRDRQMAEG